MKKYFLFFIIFIAFAQVSEAQSIFHKKSKQQKVAEDLKKRKKAAHEDDSSVDAPNARLNFSRDDYIWSSETAYSVQKKTGNISVLTPSRLGLGKNFELSTMLPENYLAPNLILKKSYPFKKFIWAHRHALYSPTIGLNWAQKNGYKSIVAPEVEIPFIMSLRNELIASYQIGSDPECSKGPPYLIFTGGLAIDAGFPFEKNYLTHINEHILGSRSPALTGQGAFLSARLRVDGRITNAIFAEGDIKFFFGNFINNNFSFEQHAGIQLFLMRNFSITIGYTFSYGHFSNSNFKIFPYADLSIYFGKKKGRDVGLFKKGMF